MAALLSKALAKDPAARYGSAEERPPALAGYLEHRASAALATAAHGKLLELERAVAAGDRESTRLRAYHLFGECRFGFKEALGAWPENANAKDGLTRAVRVMVDLELADGDPRAAQMLVVELDEAPPDLEDRVRRAAREQQAKEKRLASMARDLDPRIGRRTRLLVCGSLGVFWTLLPLVGWFVERGDPNANQRDPLVTSIASLFMATMVWFRFRRSLSRTALNRSLVRSIGVILAAQVFLYFVTLKLGVSYEQTRVLVLVSYATSACLAAAAIERRFWPGAVAYILVAIAASASPPNAWLFEVFSNLALTLNVLWIWRSDDAQEDRARIPRR
jgi:serine/threonine-protein kinase